MIFTFASLRRHRAHRQSLHRAAEALYRVVVAQARAPGFYAQGGVPDTLDGRFDMVVLHLWLVLRSLERHPGAKPLQRRLLEVAVSDYDNSLRELGVGDLGVGRRVRAMARAQAGRFQAYDAAIADNDDRALEEALARNVWRGQPPDAQKPRDLASYLRRQHLYLQEQDPAAIAGGKARFAALGDA